MKIIELRFSIPAVAPVLDLIREIGEELSSHTVVIPGPGDKKNDDKALNELWRDELLSSQEDDCKKFLALFGKEFFEEGKIAFDRGEVEPILRACAAIRLRLHESRLAGVAETTMQDMNKIQEAFIKNPKDPLFSALACFNFLSELQAIILKHLNPCNPEDDDYFPDDEDDEDIDEDDEDDFDEDESEER